jgi:hypothetical protein
MTSAFGRRNRALAPSAPAKAPKPELVLTPQQRAYLFGANEKERAAELGVAGAYPGVTPEPRPVRLRRDDGFRGRREFDRQA